MKKDSINKRLNKIPTHLIVIFTVLIWIVPTLGRFITSLRPLP
jgi:ABC-type glycerol-3-phosphate transport system permease component